ncbi:hypothetical protein [Phenylobacterium sp.]|uniref:hypothetical protein n=1 Tax=Phenylobacterium sp. TaxID=1871053 RepID=UPI0025D5785A|nr:hypothetical protein [Phenylobacterium sp.]
MTAQPEHLGPDELRAYLAAFADDFNARRSDRMAQHYAADFTAVVDGEFVDRAGYLASIDQLIAAGYAGIGFAIHMFRVLSPGHVLADGTTTLRSPVGEPLTSRFSILCERAGGRLRFAYTHSSTPRGAPAIERGAE